MFAHDSGLHKWEATELLIVDGFQQRVLRLARECLMHVLDLILKVGHGMHVVGGMIYLRESLIGQQLEVVLGNKVCCRCWCCWINQESSKLVDWVSIAS